MLGNVKHFVPTSTTSTLVPRLSSPFRPFAWHSFKCSICTVYGLAFWSCFCSRDAHVKPYKQAWASTGSSLRTQQDSPAKLGNPPKSSLSWHRVALDNPCMAQEKMTQSLICVYSPVLSLGCEIAVAVLARVAQAPKSCPGILFSTAVRGTWNLHPYLNLKFKAESCTLLIIAAILKIGG